VLLALPLACLPPAHAVCASFQQHPVCHPAIAPLAKRARPPRGAPGLLSRAAATAHLMSNMECSVLCKGAQWERGKRRSWCRIANTESKGTLLVTPINSEMQSTQNNDNSETQTLHFRCTHGRRTSYPTHTKLQGHSMRSNHSSLYYRTPLDVDPFPSGPL